MRISDWSSDVCSSDLGAQFVLRSRRERRRMQPGFDLVDRVQQAVARRVGPRLGTHQLGSGEAGHQSSSSFPIALRSSPSATRAMIAATISPPTVTITVAQPKPICAARMNNSPVIITISSEEHTSELQSLMRTSYAVCSLKNTIYRIQYHPI